MITDQGKLAISCIKWILEMLSVDITDSQLLLISLLFLSITLFIVIKINNCICKKFNLQSL